MDTPGGEVQCPDNVRKRLRDKGVQYHLLKDQDIGVRPWEEWYTPTLPYLLVTLSTGLWFCGRLPVPILAKTWGCCLVAYYGYKGYLHCSIH